MKFEELSVEEKIRNIKDNYISIIEEVAGDFNLLNKYLKITEPQVTVAKLAKILPEMSEEEKKSIEENNKKLTEQVEKLNAEARKVYELKLKDKENIIKIISSRNKVEYCICEPQEIDLSICLNSVIPEFEALLDVAREIAEKKNY